MMRTVTVRITGYGSCMTLDWTSLLLEQLTWHWDHHLRPHLDGLTDEEYFWEPVPGSWSIRPRAEATSPMAAGGGDFVADWEWPPPSPAPVTTIAWRLGHIIVGVFGERNASHFGGPKIDYLTYVWDATAKEALASLDTAYARWVEGVRGLDADALARPVGEVEGP